MTKCYTHNSELWSTQSPLNSRLVWTCPVTVGGNVGNITKCDVKEIVWTHRLFLHILSMVELTWHLSLESLHCSPPHCTDLERCLVPSGVEITVAEDSSHHTVQCLLPTRCRQLNHSSGYHSFTSHTEAETGNVVWRGGVSQRPWCHVSSLSVGQLQAGALAGQTQIHSSYSYQDQVFSVGDIVPIKNT